MRLNQVRILFLIKLRDITSTLVQINYSALSIICPLLKLCHGVYEI